MKALRKKAATFVLSAAPRRPGIREHVPVTEGIDRPVRRFSQGVPERPQHGEVEYVLNQDLRPHDEPDARFPQPMAELHVLQDRKESLVEAALPAEEPGVDRHRVSRDIVGVLRPLRLGIVDEDGLEDAEKTLVVRDAGVAPADDRPGPSSANARATAESVSSCMRQSASVKNRMSPRLSLRADVPRPGGPGVSFQLDQPARKALDDIDGPVPGAIVHDDHLERFEARREGRFEALSDRRLAVSVRDDDGDHFSHSALACSTIRLPLPCQVRDPGLGSRTGRERRR